MQKTFKRGIFDRYDGWRVRNIDAVFGVIPFIMRTRLDSQNFFETEIRIDKLEKFIREHKEDIPDLSLMHIFMAATVRLISQRPYLNRFVVHNKIYARNSITMSLMIKRTMSDDGTETLIKPEFEPEDTLIDVVRKVRELIELNMKDDAQNSTDVTAKLFRALPAWLVRFAIGLIRCSDNYGLLPKPIFRASPWHTSVFLTNLGSVGIGPIYHHLYEFGTCSLFVAMGKKYRKKETDIRGETYTAKYLGLKFVTDERVCDGHYYALSMRLFNKLLQNPEILLSPPEKVYVDEGVGKKRIDI